MIDLKNLTIKKAQDMMKAGELTSADLTAAYLKEIEKKNPEINAYLEVYSDAMDQARAADAERAAAANSGSSAALLESKPLLGIPMGIKDNILVKGKRVTAASKLLEHYVGSYDATAIIKLKSAGAVFLGRLNMDEFAMGGSTENSAFGPTRNPADTSRVPGGTSGGSAAAVAMDGALVALGSDTGGSIRQPGSFCGVVGLKPTYGSVSRHGLMPMGSSFDVIGPLAKNVDDAETIFNIIKGKDRYDSTSIDLPTNLEVPKKLRVGILPELFNMGGIDKAVLDNLHESIDKLKKAGVEIKEISIPHLKYALAVYYTIIPAEVSSNMARYDGIKYGSRVEGENLLGDYMNTRGQLLGREVRRRIMLGTYVLSSGYHDAYYNKATMVRNLLRNDFIDVFKDVDVILTPTAPSPAFKIGQNTNDPIKMYLEDVFTVTANLVGVPGISIPSGFTEVEGKKLPLGIQFMASHCREDILFAIGKIFEQLNG